MLVKIAAGAMLLLAHATVPASNLPDYPFIHVNGSSSDYYAPDTGQIDFEIIIVDADPAAGLALLQTRVADIRALLEQQAINLADLDIRDVRKDIKKPDANTPPGTVLYEIRSGARLNVRELGKWPAVAAGLLAMPNLDGFMTAFETSERQKLETALMAEALKTAQRKAENIAAGLGRKLGPANAVSSGDLKNLTRAMGLAPADFSNRDPRRAATERNAVLTVTLLQFGQSVDVIYRIAGK